MIIDRILDRRDDEHDIEIGYTHARYPDGSTRELRYSPERFYHDVLEYGAIGHDITRAMDMGTETDVRKALCAYIDEQGYNPAIKDYINSRQWLQ